MEIGVVRSPIRSMFEEVGLLLARFAAFDLDTVKLLMNIFVSPFPPTRDV